MKKKTITQLKNKCDILNRENTRERDKTCMWCKNPKTRLEVHHIISRNVLSVRYDQDNNITLCASCHRLAHSRPLEFTEFIYLHLGKERYWELIKESHQKLEPKHLEWYESKVKELTK